MRCKQCGSPMFFVDGEGTAYCPVCKVKRFRQPLEIDPKTGEWEGVTHGN